LKVAERRAAHYVYRAYYVRQCL